MQDFQEEVEKNGLRNPDSIMDGNYGTGKSSFINTTRG